MTTNHTTQALGIWLLMAVCAYGQAPYQHDQPPLQPVAEGFPPPQAFPSGVIPATAHEPFPYRPAADNEPTSSNAAPLLLAPPGQSPASRPLRRNDAPTGRVLPMIFGSLGLVLGLFLLTVWMLRRAMPASMQRLPNEVAEVLGQLPLAGRQQAHLLRLGNKLVLVAVSANGADPLAEITDAAEVDRLTGICRQTSPYSSTTAFRQVLSQFASETPAGTWWERMRGVERGESSPNTGGDA